MLRFRCVYVEPQRAMLTYHGEDGETAKLEVLHLGGRLDQVFSPDAFYDLHIHPEGGEFHPQLADDTADAGTLEAEAGGAMVEDPSKETVTTIPAPLAQPTPMPPADGGEGPAAA